MMSMKICRISKNIEDEDEDEDDQDSGYGGWTHQEYPKAHTCWDQLQWTEKIQRKWPSSSGNHI